MPGARELIAALRERGVPIGLATNSGREFATRALRAAGVLDRFDAVVSAEEVEHPKPAPDVYLEAAARLGADPAALRRARGLRDGRRRGPRGRHDGRSACRRSRASRSTRANLVVPALTDPRVWELLELPIPDERSVP